MKKIIFILTMIIFSLMLSSCNKESIDENTQEKQNTQEIAYSGDDLAIFYSSEDNVLTSAINLYMREAAIPYNDEKVAEVINSCNIGFEEANGERYINYIYFNGNPVPFFTGKNIHTTGLNYLDEEKCSNESDVISAYGINADAEEVYFKPSESSESNIIALYFKVDNEGNVSRVKYPKGEDISSFNALDDVNAYVYYEVKDSKVIGLELGCK